MLFTHIAIAADSFVDPRRAFTVLRTALIHLQNRFACEVGIFYDRLRKNLL